MRETGVRCSRCNRPICPDCMRPASVGFHCPDDVRLANRSVRRPRTVVGAPVATSERPLVTWGLIGLNVLVYLVTVGQSGNINNPVASSLFGDWTLNPYYVAHAHQYDRLVLSAFLHLSVVHIAFNMLALGFVGPFLERIMGWWRYLALYLLSALGGGVCVYLFGNQLGSTAGASGAIFGLFAASIILGHRLGIDLRALIATIVINFIFTFSVRGVSIEGHIGGFVVGALAALAIVGLPAARIPRPGARVQGGLLVVLLVVLVAITLARTATFPAIS